MAKILTLRQQGLFAHFSMFGEKHSRTKGYAGWASVMVRRLYGDEGGGISVLVRVASAAGANSVRIHETGTCDPAEKTPFEFPGDRFNPTEAHHGAPGEAMSHAGDLGNLTAEDDGSAEFSISTERVSLTPRGLVDANGSALLIHAEADDPTTDLSGESGDRFVCSVIAASTSGTPAVSPVASPVT